MAIAAAFAIACAGAAPADASHTETAVRLAGQIADFSQSAIREGYAAAPALMLCLGLALAFPVLTIAFRISRRFSRPQLKDGATRRYKPPKGIGAGTDANASVAVAGDVGAADGAAFLDVEGAPEARFAILRDMLRIGREDDNDIRIPSDAVHRYHAAIHREDLDGWHITDLSGTGGNGVIVNGRRCSDVRLNDGDIIELGPGRLRFRVGCA
jgi:hypothetical protein